MLALPRIASTTPGPQGGLKKAAAAPEKGFAAILKSLLSKAGAPDKAARNDASKTAPQGEAKAGGASVASPRADAAPKANGQHQRARKAESSEEAEPSSDAQPLKAKNRGKAAETGLATVDALAVHAAPTKDAQSASKNSARVGRDADEAKADPNEPVKGRGASETQAKPKVTVVDLRLTQLRGKPSNDRPESDAKRGAPEFRLPEQPGIALRQREPAPEAAGGVRPNAVNAKADPRPASLAESLAGRLRDGAADIVRSAQIVLRDGDAGLIRLRLEPESLGNVKIELKLAEKQISGKIVVESDIAGEAFRSSLDALRDAFAESGFETTSLELEVRNGMASGGKSGGGASDDGAGPYFSRSLRSLGEAVPQAAAPSRDGLLDLMV